MRKKRKNGLLVVSIASFMLLAMAGFATITYGVWGYSRVNATGNTAIITAGEDQEATIVISKNGKDFGENVSDALNGELELNQDSYTEAGVLYIKNTSSTDALIQPKVTLDSPEITGEELLVQVDLFQGGVGNKPYFTGPLSQYGEYDLGILGEFDLKAGETARLEFAFKPNRGEISLEPPIHQIQLDFDLAFEVSDGIEPISL
jgi:hypothetical protein